MLDHVRRQNLRLVVQRDRAQRRPPCPHPEGSLVMVPEHPTWRQLRCTRCRQPIATYRVVAGDYTLERYYLPDGEASCVL